MTSVYLGQPILNLKHFYVLEFEMFQLNCVAPLWSTLPKLYSVSCHSLYKEVGRSLEDLLTRILEREMFLQVLIDFLCLIWFYWIQFFQSSIKKMTSSEF